MTHFLPKMQNCLGIIILSFIHVPGITIFSFSLLDYILALEYNGINLVVQTARHTETWSGVEYAKERNKNQYR